MSSSAKKGNLRLSLLDVLGNPIGGRVDVQLRHLLLEHRPARNGIDASKRITIPDLFGAPQGNYRYQIDPSAYLPTDGFINIEAEGMTDLKVTCPINPKKVANVDFPPFPDLPAETQKLLERSDQVLFFEGLKGEALYNKLDSERKANVLNLALKSALTPLSNGVNVLSLVEKIKEIRGDRFFVTAPRELRQEAKHGVVTGTFNDAPDVMHQPSAGFARAGSVKTRDKFGNLQLTFFLNDNQCEVDIDIDPNSGVSHAFDVIEHTATGIETHPYAVRDILIKRQKIDPGYRFVV